MYTGEFIALNAAQFLDHEWIDVPTLKRFLSRQDSGAGDPPSMCHSSSGVPNPATLVTSEPAPTIAVKPEPQLVLLPAKPAAPVKIRTSYEGGREVLELSSDSEPEPDLETSDIEEVAGELTRSASRSSSIISSLGA